MVDREKVLDAVKRCGKPGACSPACAYYYEGYHCFNAMKNDIIKLLEQKDDRQKES